MECEALGRKPKEALRLALRTSTSAFTALNRDRRPVAMLGVCSTNLLCGHGVPWMLGTDEVFDCGRDLLELGPRIIGSWAETFSVMENIVAAENVKAIRLLRHWGAEIGDAVETHGGVAFVPFRFSAAIQGEAGSA